MRWTSGIFSIAMLTRHNMANPDYKLDGNDQMILEDMWYMIPRSECIPLNDQSEPVSDKCRKNKTESKLWYIDDEDGFRYYNIRYKTIAQDLPNLDLEERAINRRVDKYVASHLLVKKVIRSSVTGGKYSYFQFTSAFLNLIYDAENPYHKINPLEETVPDEEEKDSVMPDETEAPVTEDVPNDVGIPPTDSKVRRSVSEDDPTNQMTVGSGPTVKNDVGRGTYEPNDSRFVTNGVPTDSKVRRPTNHNDVGIGGATYSNDGRSNIDNTNIYSIINNYKENQPASPVSHDTSDTNSETVSDIQSDDMAGRQVFYSELKNKFGYEPRFNPDPYLTVRNYFEAEKIDCEHMSDYVSWMYDYLRDKCRKKDSFPAFFGISVSKKWNLDRWLNLFREQLQDNMRKSMAEAEKQKNYMACPVCGTNHDSNDSICPHCKTSADMLTNEQGLMIARDVWLLRQTDPARADAYYAEVTDASADMMSPDWMRLSAEDRMQAREEMNKAINEIHSKYFVAIPA